MGFTGESYPMMENQMLPKKSRTNGVSMGHSLGLKFRLSRGMIA